jgi:DNA repair protein RecN (Recombination protein N)
VDGRFRTQGHEELLTALDDLGTEEEDGELLVVRRITKDGRSRAQIGGVPVPIGTLSRLLGSAVTLHGQSDQARLRGSDQQREALDSFGHAAIEPLIRRHQELWGRRATLRERLEELEALLQDRERREERLRHVLERIEEVDPSPGEEHEVRRRLEMLGHAVDLREGTGNAAGVLAGDEGPSVLSLLDAVIDLVGAAARTDDTLEGSQGRLLAARIELADVSADLSRYADDIDASPGSLDLANERLHQLTTLVAEVSADLDGAEDTTAVLENSRSAVASLDAFTTAADDHAAALAELDGIEAQLEDAATQLTAARTAAAAELSRAVGEELRHLDMPEAKVRVDVAAHEPRAHGRDRVEILLAPHPGASYLPIATAASGGELSRVMLALEVALASVRTEGTAAPVFVFDEIDAGIGGRAALAVGQRLAALAQVAQVIVVTHLPQVAAHASRHLRISKHSANGQTRSTVELLDHEQRVSELARMLSGDVSELALAHATELLEQTAAPVSASTPAPAPAGGR